jgi:hypothetical protein
MLHGGRKFSAMVNGFCGRMARRMVSITGARVPAGLATLGLGVVLTILSYSGHQSWSTQRFWPLLVVGFGVLRIGERSNRIAGWVLLVVGGAVQLSNLGLFVLPAREVVRYWPVTVMLAGVREIALSRSAGAKGEGLAVLCLGAWLQLSYFGAPHISSYRPWPLVLAALGGVMVWRGLCRRGSA